MQCLYVCLGVKFLERPSQILMNFGGFGEPSINETYIHAQLPETYIHAQKSQIQNIHTRRGFGAQTYILVWSLARLLEDPPSQFKKKLIKRQVLNSFDKDFDILRNEQIL